MRDRAFCRGWAVLPLLLVTALLTSCGEPKPVSDPSAMRDEIVDAMNADVADADAPVTFGKNIGIISRAMLAYRTMETESDSKQLNVQFSWCTTKDSKKEDCKSWAFQSVDILLDQVDPGSVTLKPDKDKESISFACETGKECASPAPVGLPCRDQPACDRVRDNMSKLVRLAHGEKIEPPVS
jgi:hypothetical protein